jgi:hypothetical protein
MTDHRDFLVYAAVASGAAAAQLTLEHLAGPEVDLPSLVHRHHFGPAPALEISSFERRVPRPRKTVATKSYTGFGSCRQPDPMFIVHTQTASIAAGPVRFLLNSAPSRCCPSSAR